MTGLRSRISGAARKRWHRLADWLLTGLLLAALTAAVLFLDRRNEQSLLGQAAVADGDSLQFGGQRVRIFGIDAPEFDQTCIQAGKEYPCGRRARDMLRSLVNGPVSCLGGDMDRYGRLLARCESGGRDIGREMVLSGWALSYGAYSVDEALARDAGRGLWAGEFEEPRAYRLQKGVAAEAGHGWFGLLLEKFRILVGSLKS